MNCPSWSRVPMASPCRNPWARRSGFTCRGNTASSRSRASCASRFTSERPIGFWEQLQASEYGFWANVNPEVSHPRWSQAIGARARHRRAGPDATVQRLWRITSPSSMPEWKRNSSTCEKKKAGQRGPAQIVQAPNWGCRRTPVRASPEAADDTRGGSNVRSTIARNERHAQTSRFGFFHKQARLMGAMRSPHVPH